nr:MAG TPA: hypothetical protein [Caudoviricetes sp.]
MLNIILLIIYNVMCPDFGLFHCPIVQILDFLIFDSPNFGLL